MKARKSKTEVPADPVSSEGLFHGVQMAVFSLCPLVRSKALTLLKNTSQLFCRVSLSLDLSDVSS